MQRLYEIGMQRLYEIGMQRLYNIYPYPLSLNVSSAHLLGLLMM